MEETVHRRSIYRGALRSAAALALVLVGWVAPVQANIDAWAEHEGKYYVFAGANLVFHLSLSHPCVPPLCRVLSVPQGATTGSDPNLKLYWNIPPEKRGNFSSSHQFCDQVNQAGTACADWGPVLLTQFVVIPFFEVPAIEITQSIQNLHNQMPLVPHKETYVRVYVQMAHAGVSGVFDSVTAELHAFDAETDQELPGSPIRPINKLGYVYPVTVDVTDPDADSKRKRWGSTLNYRLDRSWLYGSVRLEVTDEEGRPAFDCDPMINPGGPERTCAAAALFHSELELHTNGVPATWPEIKFVAMPWRDARNRLHDPMPGNDTEVPTEFAERLVSMAPIDGVTWDAFKLFWSLEDVPHRIATYPTKAEVEVFYAEQLLKLLRIGFADYRANDEGTIPFYHGIVSGPVGYYKKADGSVRRMNGIASSVPGIASISRADRPRTFVHEFMHLVGFGHAVTNETTPNGWKKGSCGALASASAEVFGRLYDVDGDGDLDPTIGKMDLGQGWADYVFGLDTVLSEEGEPQVISPDESFAITSYCGGEKRWTSDLTYGELVENIWDGAGFLDDHAGVLLSGFRNQLKVFGRVALDQPTAVLAPLFETSTSIIPPPLPAGSYNVQLLDGAGGVLQEISFDPIRLELDLDEGAIVEPSKVALFYVMADADPRIEQVVVRQGATVLATAQASASPPTVQVLSPNGGELLSGSEAVVSWAGADADGDSLTYMLEYSADDGAHWAPLAVDITQTEYTVETHLLTATLEGRMRVTVSDGVRSVSDESDAAFNVPNHPPRVIVTSPAPDDDTLFVEGQTISLLASAFDREDGPVPDFAIEWRSDLSGVLGYGRALSVSALVLAEGQHEITVAASDSQPLIGEATTRLRVLHAAPPALTDLGLHLDGPVELVAAGQPFTMTITIANDGPDSATGVASVTPIPALMNIDDVTSSAGSCATVPGQISCNIGTLAAQASATITIDAQVTEVGDFPITSTVSGAEVDPGLADNTASLLVPEPSLASLVAGGATMLIALVRRRPWWVRRSALRAVVS
jgi:hypothetical protein